MNRHINFATDFLNCEKSKDNFNAYDVNKLKIFMNCMKKIVSIKDYNKISCTRFFNDNKWYKSDECKPLEYFINQDKIKEIFIYNNYYKIEIFN